MKPGTYDVDILAASPKKGVKIALAIGDQEIFAALPETGNFARFQAATLGKITVKQPGELAVKSALRRQDLAADQPFPDHPEGDEMRGGR